MPDPSQLAKTIASDFYNNTFDLSHREPTLDVAGSGSLPELEVVKQLHDLHVEKRTVRIFLTLISAMDRARDATRLWRAGVDLFKRCPEVFNPNDVAMMSIGALTEQLGESGVSQRHGPDTRAWHRIASSLASGSGPVCRLIDTGTGNAEELRNDLRSHDYMDQPRYPMLCGPKIGPMWIRIIVWPGCAEIAQIENIPVAVDVHVRRVTENLGVSDAMGLELRKAKLVIQEAWRSAVRSADIGGPLGITGTCAALDPALWFFGKHGCSHCERLGQRQPISKACNSCRYPFSSHEQ